jgi:polysaccharide transporter, PST family
MVNKRHIFTISHYLRTPLIKDYFFMVLNQIALFILPILIIPFLLPTIGKTYFSIILITNSISAFFLIFFDFGISYYGTKRVSVLSKKHTVIPFVNIQFLKFLLVLIGLIPFIIINFFVQSNFYLNFIIIYYFAISLQGMLPLWYFQGTSNFLKITFTNIVNKGFLFVFIIVFIREEKHWINYSYFLLISNLLGLFLSLYFVNTFQKISLKFVKYNLVKKYFLKSFSYFRFNFISTIYISLGPALMSVLKFDPGIITDYGIAEKIVRGVRYVFTPLTKVLYPYLSKTYMKSKELYYKKLKKTVYLVTLLSSLFCLIVFYFSVDIAKFMVVEDYYSTAKIIKSFSLLIIFGTLANVFISLGLMATSKINNSNNLILIASVVYLIFILASNTLLGVYSFVYAVLLAEIILIIGSVFYMKR